MNATASGQEGRQLVVRRLRAFAPVSAEDEATILSLHDGQRWAPGSELVRDNEPLHPRFLVDGWAARVRWLEDGRRQIIAFVLPGDAIGLCERPQPLALAAIVAITPAQTVDASPVEHRLRAGASALSDAVHLTASFEEACLIDQVVRLGRQTAYERISHLLLELQLRLRMVGLGTATSFPCPLTQEVIADATGLSVVHVNRTLQAFRKEGLLDLRQGRATLSEPDLLASICDYRRPEPSAARGREI